MDPFSMMDSMMGGFFGGMQPRSQFSQVFTNMEQNSNHEQPAFFQQIIIGGPQVQRVIFISSNGNEQQEMNSGLDE